MTHCASTPAPGGKTTTMRESHREHRSAQGGLMSLLAQITAYIVSPLATLLAVWVAYLALSRNSQPQLLAYYQPNPDVPSVIDLVVENIGGGSAIEVGFSEPLPINCFGIEAPRGGGASVPT